MRRRFLRATVGIVGWTALASLLAPADSLATNPAGPVLGAEQETDAPVLSAAAEDQWRPSVASDGHNFYVLWSDRRRDRQGVGFGSFIAPPAEVLDPYGRRTGLGRGARLAFNGDTYLAVWSDGYDIVGRRATRDGSILDEAPIRISPHLDAAGNQNSPEIAWNGSEFLVVWNRIRFSPSGVGHQDVEAARVSPEGVVLDDVPIAITTTTSDDLLPRVASAAGDFLVVWGEADQVRGTRVVAGQVIDATPLTLAYGGARPGEFDLAAGPDTYLVVWSENRGGAGPVVGRRVHQDGTLDTSSIVINDTWAPNRSPTVTWSSTSFVVAWVRNPTTVSAARVGGDGAVLDPGGLEVGTSSEAKYFPRVAANGQGEAVVVWEQLDISWYDVALGAIRADGTVTASDVLVSKSANTQVHPALAYNNNNFVMAWSDWRAGHQNVYASVVNGAGSGVLTSPRQLSDGVGPALDPSVAWDGTTNLVVWRENSRLMAVPVSATGEPSGSPKSVTDVGDAGLTATSVAAGGTDFLVAWRTGWGITALWVARVDQAGDILGTPIRIREGQLTGAAIAWDGEKWVVAWKEFGWSGATVMTTRVSGGGAVVDATPIAVGRGGEDDSPPALASTDTQSVAVVWAGDGIRARVLSNTTLGSEMSVTNDPTDTAPGVTWGGDQFTLGWRRNGPSPGIRAARLRGDSVVDAEPLTVAAGDADSERVVLASGIYGRTLLSLRRWEEAEPRRAYRVWFKSLDDPTNDLFAQARRLQGLNGGAVGTSIGATKEPGEPNHNGLTGGASVWHRWTAPALGAVTFTTAGTAFPTLLAIYTGNEIETLQQPFVLQETRSGNTRSVTFLAVPGTTYSIAVDGAQGQSGNLQLQWSYLRGI